MRQSNMKTPTYCPECKMHRPHHVLGCPETPDTPEEPHEQDPDDARDAKIDRDNDRAAAANYEGTK